MTKEELIEKRRTRGGRCPFCDSQTFEQDGFADWVGNEMHQGFYCQDCDKGWTDIFTFSGAESDGVEE